jgi:cell division FtsZ-interacting protein ZapD
MSLKDKLVAEGMKLTQSPAVGKLLQDERFMRLVVLAMSMPGKVSTFTAEQKERFAKEMGLATSDEVRDLKRQLSALEDTVRRLERKIA